MLDDNRSHVRVFLSADLVGSTRLKNRLNHQELLEKYRARRDVIARLREQDLSLQIAPTTEIAAVLESLGVGSEDYDWATVVRSFYQGVHTEFQSALQEENASSNVEQDLQPWKAVGDELIYQLVVPGRQELHQTVIAFLRAVRTMDSKVPSSGGIAAIGLRVKGAAWVAGFPVRNRQVTLPPDDRPDFLGPDMDTGFRMAKCTRAGMLVGSIELAELIGECQGKYAPMLGKIVGWEKLQGVWNDQQYPVIWIDFPDSHPAAALHPAKTFSQWDQEECKWCKAWEDESKPKVQLSGLAAKLVDVRRALPTSFGLVDPYILGDPLEIGQIPPDHQEILDLLTAIENHQPGVQQQRSDDGLESPVRSSTVEEDVESARNLIKDTAPTVEQPDASPQKKD